MSVSDRSGDATIDRLVRFTDQQAPRPFGSADIRRVSLAVVPSRWLCVQITSETTPADRRLSGYYARVATDQASGLASLSLGNGGAEWAPPGAPETEPVNTFFRRTGSTVRYAIKIGPAPSGVYGMSFDAFRFSVHSAASPGNYRRQAFAIIDCVPGWHAYPSGKHVPAPTDAAQQGDPDCTA